jgi:hypothetical protein
MIDYFDLKISSIIIIVVSFSCCVVSLLFSREIKSFHNFILISNRNAFYFCLTPSKSKYFELKTSSFKQAQARLGGCSVN